VPAAPRVDRVTEDNERFRDHAPAVAATAIMTIAVTVGTSYLGVAGTLAGLAAGSLISGAGAWWAEKAIRRSAAVTAARARAARAKGRPLSDSETRLIRQVHGSRQYGIGWGRIAALAAAGLLIALAAVTVTEHLAGKPVADLVTHRGGHGTTLGGSVTSPQPAPGRARPAVTETPAGTASPVIVASPASAAPSPVPDADPAAVPDASPVSTAAASPTGVSSPAPTGTGTPPP
jgi:hypothetical protein